MLSQVGEINSIRAQREVLKTTKQFEEIAAIALLTGAIACTFAPLFLECAKPYKTLLHLAGFVSAGLASVTAMENARKEGVYKTLANIEKEVLKSGFQNSGATLQLAATIDGQMQAVRRIASLPYGVETRYQLARQQGLGDLFVSEFGHLLPMPAPMQTIDVAANDPSRVGAIAGIPSQPAMNLVPNAQDLQDALNPAPPYRDLPVEIADYDGHIAYVSKTRSGKTSSMIRSIQRSLSTGKHVIVIDCKGDARLRDLPGVEYVHFNSADKFPVMNAIINNILGELKNRQDTPGNYISIDIYVDEYNLGMDACSDFGKTEDLDTGKEQPAEKKWAKSWKKIVLQGAAAGLRLRASGHTSRVEDWGWNTGVLDSVSFVALARKGLFESIEDLIQHQIASRLKEQFKNDLERYRGMDFGEVPLILTTMPPVGYCVLPTVEESIAPPTTASTITLKADVPPESTTVKHDPKIKPRDLDAPNPTRQMFAEFRQWYFANDPVSDDMLRAKWLELRGEELADHAIAPLRGLMEKK